MVKTRLAVADARRGAAASPRRVEFQLELIGDWTPDDPVTVAVKALMPDWVRWLGERAGLPEHLRVSAIEAPALRDRRRASRHRGCRERTAAKREGVTTAVCAKPERP
ncbi:MAG: hypothetical protein M3Z25_05175 [Actinomycetota bacterium]|nr:hypothetical protein [Actinomycetota bacterium]